MTLLIFIFTFSQILIFQFIKLHPFQNHLIQLQHIFIDQYQNLCICCLNLLQTNYFNMDQDEQQKNNPKIKESDHSLGPDIYTGWQSKTQISKLKQFPLIFAHQNTDLISKTLTSFGSDLPYKVVYMGFRPSSNMKAFKQYGQNKHNKNVLQSFLYTKKSLKRFKFHHLEQPQKYFPIRPSEYRLFTGVNPTWKHQDIKFSSEFQGGNLDLAINIGPNEYDLLMRVDSNTKGHTSWFFYKVYNIKKKKKIKFNIINFNKNNLLYGEGLKPYVFRTSKMTWSQEGIDVQFKNKTMRYFTDKDEPVVSKCLSFSYQFEDLTEEVYFAYSIPYSYSYLLDCLQQLQKKHSQFIKINYDNQTTGGLPLPIVTITNFTKQTDKKHHLIIGRLHPGESQGSWMIQGFMKFMCSAEAYHIRDKIQFKIMPMVNVDGVVLGNFRTGIGGRDLNRMFNKPQLFNETRIIKSLAKELNPEVFIDFHGHSGKKNVFIYGPQYKIQDRQYLVSRLFPKIISKKTQAFRYYSCIFRISQSKINTGRAFMFFQIKTRFVFTVEASTYAFGNSRQKTMFNAQKYFEVGFKIGESLQDFTKVLSKLPKRLQFKNQQKLEKSDSKNQIKLLSKSGQAVQLKNINIQSFFQDIQSVIQKQLLNQIMQNQKELTKNQKGIELIQAQSQNSDCQNEDQDYSQQQLKKLQKNLTINRSPDSIQKILGSKSRPRLKKIEQKQSKKDLGKLKIKKKNTIQSILKHQGNKSLILSRQFIKNRQIYVDRNKAQSSFQRIQQNVKNQPVQIKQKSHLKYFGNKNQEYLQNQNQKLRKLNAWRSSQLKKYQDLQFFDLQRNKSTNNVYIEGPSQSKTQPLHKVPKIRSQMKRNQPVLMIRKSFLPTVIIKKTNNSRFNMFQSLNDPEIQRNHQKSLINQILEIHQRKKRKNHNKMNRRMKIVFYQQ